LEQWLLLYKQVPRSTITLSLNCFKVPLIQKYWKTINYQNHCIFKQTWPKFENMIIFTHFILLFLFRHKVQKFCFQSLTNIRSSYEIWPKCWYVGFTLLKFFEKFSFPCWLLLLNQSMAPISSLTWHLKKVWKKASMIIV